jgi:hypothetical protein
MLIDLTENEIKKVSGGDYADQQMDLYPDWPSPVDPKRLQMNTDKDWQLYVDNMPLPHENENCRGFMRDSLSYYDAWLRGLLEGQ